MKPFSTDSRCPKCGNQHVTVEHVHNIVGEFMARRCMGCGYDWREAPLDAEAAAPSPRGKGQEGVG